jgi:hypothetical protein
MELTKKNMLNYPLNGYQMMALNPDSKLITYDQLNNIDNIDDLFHDTNKLIILYLLKSKNDGHWVCLFLNKDGYNYFDSYGEPEDEHLSFLTKKQRREFNEKRNKLSELLRHKKVIFNNVRLQASGTDTCGMFVTHRLHHSNKNLVQYIDIFLKKNVWDLDKYVANYTLKLFKKYNIE